MNGGNVVCESGLHFDQNDESNLCSNDEISILNDCIFETKVEHQEMSMNDSHLTPLEESSKE